MDIQMWYQAGYIDPSDLSLGANDGIMVRPYLLKIDDNQQAFKTYEQRQTYLDWRIKLEQTKGSQSGF